MFWHAFPDHLLQLLGGHLGEVSTPSLHPSNLGSLHCLQGRMLRLSEMLKLA